MRSPNDPLFMAFIAHLVASNKASTAQTYGGFLLLCEQWMQSAGVTAGKVTTEDLRNYQRWLSETYLTQDGKSLAQSTKATAILVIKSCYRYLCDAGHLLFNPAEKLVPPKRQRALTVAKAHLSQEEIQALIETSGALVAETKTDSIPWAIASRNRALITLACATGRRCQGLLTLALSDINFDRAELRVTREKGRMGRVLPVAGWAITAVQHYLAGPRQLLLGVNNLSAYLFVSQRAERLSARGYAFVVRSVIAETITRNPDLTELPTKRISTHSLRVSFAKLMHDHQCSIRTLNELMLHRSLNTTAAYTPTSVDDLRRALLPCHPRA
jgi:integrase/recombinase XerD